MLNSKLSRYQDGIEHQRIQVDNFAKSVGRVELDLDHGVSIQSLIRSIYACNPNVEWLTNAGCNGACLFFKKQLAPVVHLGLSGHRFLDRCLEIKIQSLIVVIYQVCPTTAVSLIFFVFLFDGSVPFRK